MDNHQSSPTEHNDDSETSKTTFLGVLGRTIKFLFSTAGLGVLNLAYIMLGALIFSHLEKFNEEQTCITGASNYHRAENATMRLLMNVTNQVAMGRLQIEDSEHGPVYQAVRGDLAKVLRVFSLSVIDVGYNVSKNCSQLGQPNGPQYKWSIEGSMMFAMTVTTTIGYGVLAPKTSSGRLACIAYAMMGIPLMILCLATVGEVMAHIFRYVYAVVCCCGCCRAKPKKLVRSEIVPVPAYRTDVTGRPIPESLYEEYEDDTDWEDESEEEITVPLTISMVVLLSFTFFGAALFAVWEGWNFIDATYFCFVTYSTIGFGDIVPGTTNLDSPNSRAQLVVTGIYQILGMAMLSMCFQLMQDEMVAKFQWLGQKCGLCKAWADKTNHNEEEVSLNQSGHIECCNEVELKL